MRGFPWAVAILLLGSGMIAVAPPVLAYPGEPTVEVALFPTDVTVDGSDFNAVDTVFLVNITARNQFGARDHTMWVNITFAVDKGWAVTPMISNLTYELAPQEQEETSIPVTVTIPPGASATDAAIFSVDYDETNSMRFSMGMSGNRTAQIHIRQIFSTGATFSNGSNQATVVQGRDAVYNLTVTNNGNGDAEYDARVLNANDLRPNDIEVESTTPGVAPENGNAQVRVTLHALPAAIPGTYPVQIRVFATAAGENPPPGAYADLTATLNVRTAPTPPPPGNNTTNPPPPPGNNTTNPPGGKQPPKDFIAQILEFVQSPAGFISAGLLLATAVIIGVLVRTRRAKARRRLEQLERVREKRLRSGGGGAGPTRMTGPPGSAGRAAPSPNAPRPVRRPASGSMPRPPAQDLKRRGSP